MTDYSFFENGQKVSMRRLAAQLEMADLRRLTNEMVDKQLELISNVEDVDVVFVPEDPEAYDKYAEDDSEKRLSWTLGHVIVHTTASAEESAALAAELARGVTFHGRSRYETPWETVTTVAQLRQRLVESRRIRLASLDMWPDKPHLDNRYQAWTRGHAIGPVERFLLGLRHDMDHVGQIEAIVRQARAARGEVP